MTRALKKRVLSWLMAMVVFVSVFAAYRSVSIKVQAAVTLTTEQIEKAIAWALSWEGQSTFYDQDTYQNVGSNGWCTKFIKNAFVYQAGAPYYSLKNAKVWGDMWTTCTDTSQIPPRGALVFYDCWADFDNLGYKQNYGHVALSLGNGKVIEGGFSKVQVSDYTSHGGCTYTGYGAWNGMSLPNAVPETPPEISAPTSKAEVEARINSIINGQYGNGKTFPYSSTPVPVSLAGEAGGTGTFGYARYVFYQVFGISMSPGVAQNEWQLSNSNGNLVTVASCGGNSDASTMKTDIFKTKPGDVIQGKGSGFYQTMIVLSHDENSITILDCDNDYKCGIAVRTRDWAKFAGAFKQYTIYRSKNYPVVPLTTPVPRFDKSEYRVGDTIKVTWNASSADSDLDHYNVYLKDSNNNTVFNSDTKTASYSFTLNKAGTYKLYVFAVPSNGNSIGTTGKISVVAKTSMVIPVNIPSPKGLIKGDLAYTTYSDGLTLLNKVNIVDGYGEIVINSTSDSSVVYTFFLSNFLAPREYTHIIKNGKASGMDSVELYLLGDVDGSGSIKMQDVILAFRATRNSGELTSYQIAVADANKDGNAKMSDVRAIYNHTRGVSLWS